MNQFSVKRMIVKVSSGGGGGSSSQEVNVCTNTELVLQEGNFDLRPQVL